MRLPRPARLGLPRAFWYLWAGTLVNRLGFVEPFLALYLTEDRGMSASGAGLVLAAWGAGGVASQLVGGALADAVGRRETLALGMVAAAASLLLLALAPALALIVVAAALVGLSVDLYRPASSALVADIVPAERRARAFGALFWAVNLGFAAATVLGGLLAGIDFRLVFVLDAITSLLFAAVVWRGTRGAPVVRGGGRLALAFGVALRDRLFLAFVALTFAYAVVYAQAFVTLPLQFDRDGLGPAAYGAVIAVNGVVIVLAQPLLVRPLEGRDPAFVLAGSLAVFGAGVAAQALASSAAAYAVCVAVWTLGEIGVAVVAPALVAALAPPAARGRYMGVWGLGFGAAFLVGPLAGTLAFDHAGPAVLWVACGLVALAAAGGHLGLRGPLSRRLAPGAA